MSKPGEKEIVELKDSQLIPESHSIVEFTATFGDASTIKREEAVEAFMCLKSTRKVANMFGVSVSDIKRIIGEIKETDHISYAADDKRLDRVTQALAAMSENLAHQWDSLTPEQLENKNLTQGLERKTRALVQLNAEFVRGATLHIDASQKTLNVTSEHLLKQLKS